MDNNSVIRLLTDYRSYKFALTNLGVLGESDLPQRCINQRVYSERKPLRLSNYNAWYDKERYNRVVTTLESAVEFVLNDDQQAIIKYKYMDRENLNLGEIADRMHKDRKTVSTQHKKAINSLSKALLPISQDYMEINNLDYMLDVIKQPA